VRTFPKGDESPRVVWQGLDEKKNPLELSVEDKSILAHFAKSLGLKKATDCLKIEMKLLRAWVGAYCRKEKPPNIKRPIELSKEGKSPLSTIVSKSDLPPFPVFNDSWEAPVQSEWLVTYLELTKLRGAASP